MFNRLHIKLTLYMGLVLMGFMIFNATGIYNFTRFVFIDGTKKLMQSEAVRIYSYIDVEHDETSYESRSILSALSPKLAIMGSDKLEANYIVYDAKLDTVCLSDDENQYGVSEKLTKLAEYALDSKEDSYVTRRVLGINYRIYTKYFPNNNNPRIVQVYQNTVNEEVIWSFLRTVLFVFGSTGIFILLCISFVFTGQALKPVRETWVRQKEFIADASHELRTPLTVIQTNLDVVLSNEEGTYEENKLWLDNAYSETGVMAKLIENLLTLAKADANRQKLDITEFSLSEMVENICINMENIAKNKKLDFELKLEEGIIMKADYDKVRRMLVILIDNAIKYTSIGKVTVSLYTDKNKKIFVVEDTGIGIGKEDITRIFDRFYRADKARHREGGSGLGLSIAKWIADIHRFTITVDSSIDEGSRFTVKM